MEGNWVVVSDDGVNGGIGGGGGREGREGGREKEGEGGGAGGGGGDGRIDSSDLSLLQQYFFEEICEQNIHS